MRFDLLTIFPEFFVGPCDVGMVRRARQQGLIDVQVHDLRSFTTDKHHVVDDRPFGGGDGMVLKPEPIFAAVETLLAQTDSVGPVAAASGAAPQANQANLAAGGRTAVVLLSPQGRVFTQAEAQRFARDYRRMILLCGRYEGVDERVVEHLITDEISIGDYVLTGGELPALILLDAVMRLLPGVLGGETSAAYDSFSDGLLDYPHYTRPAIFRDWAVPEVLIGGHHGKVAAWRRRAALRKTQRMRPDLMEGANISPAEREWLAQLEEEMLPVGARKQE